MKMLLTKLRSLPRTFWIIGIPLVCGVIIGTIVTMSIPKIKADTSLVGATTNQVSSTANPTSIPVATNENLPQPTSIPPTMSLNNPTGIQAQQSSTTNQQNPTIAPCH